MLGSAAARAFLSVGWRVAGADDLEAGFRTSVPQDATFVELRPLGSPAGASQLAAVIAALALGSNETGGEPGLDAVVLGFDVRRPDAEAALAQALRGVGLGEGTAGTPWTIAVDDGGRARGLYGASLGPQCRRGATAGAAAEGDGGGEAARWCAAAAADASDSLPLLALVSLRDSDGCVPSVVGIGMSPASPTVLRAVARAGEAGASADDESAAAALVSCTARFGAEAALGTEHKFDMLPLLHSLLAAIAPAGSPPFGGERLPEACYPHYYSWVRPVEDGGGGCGAQWVAAAAAPAVHASALAHAVVVTAAAAVESGGPAAEEDPSSDSLTVALRSAAATAAGAGDGDRASVALVIDTRSSPLTRRLQDEEGQEQQQQKKMQQQRRALAAVPARPKPKTAWTPASTSAPALAAAAASMPSRPPTASSSSAPSAEVTSGWEWTASPERALPPPLLPALALRRPGLKLGPVLSLCPHIIEELERLGVLQPGSAASAAALGNATTPPTPLPGSDARPAALLDAAWWGLRHGVLGGYREPHPSAADFGYDAWSALGAGDRYVLADVALCAFPPPPRCCCVCMRFTPCVLFRPSPPSSNAVSVTHGFSHERAAWTQYTYGSWLKRGGIPLFSTVPDPVLPARATMYQPSDDEVREGEGREGIRLYEIEERTEEVPLAALASASTPLPSSPPAAARVAR